MDKRSTLCKARETTRRLTCGYVNRFDKAGTIHACDRLLKPEREPRRGRLASSLAVSIGILVCLIAIDNPVAQIEKAEAKSIITISPKSYAKALLNDNTQFKCIDQLYTKESNWNPKAKNGSHYGIPQMRNDIMLSKNPLQQVSLGVKYISHRYGVTTKGVPNACKALHHLKTKGWH